MFFFRIFSGIETLGARVLTQVRAAREEVDLYSEPQPGFGPREGPVRRVVVDGRLWRTTLFRVC